MQPLFDVLASCNKGIPFLLTEAAREGFHELKLAITSAPALGIPNYEIPFELYCYEVAGHAKGVLTQKHGEKPHPVGYYSAQLDAVMRGASSCIRAVAACAILKDKVADIVLDHNLVIQVPHGVQELLAPATTKHLSIARLTKYEVALLTSPNVIVKRCTTLNPATLLPDSDIQSITGEHDCVSLMKMESKILDNVIETPISDPDAEYYVDGSRFYQDDKPYTGYAVVGPFGTLKSEALPAGMSAQEAELVALTEACVMAKDLAVNIYTDSRYAFGVARDYGPIWQSRNFVGASGKPIKNARLVAQLFEALKLPKQVAVVKVKAHTKDQSKEAEGNRRADEAAKAAALLPLPMKAYTVSTVAGEVDLQVLQKLQAQSSDDEKEGWKKKGAELSDDGVWKVGMRLCLPKVLYSMMCSLAHKPTHQSKDAM
ncbi:genomic stop codons, partial [Pristimantis euphronides]